MLKDRLNQDVKEALKSGDKDKRLVLSMLMSAIKNKELIKRGQLSKTILDTTQLESQSQLVDEEILEVISSEAKKRKESIEQFKAGGREELAAKEQTEQDILLSYLPEQLSEEEIKREVARTIQETGAHDPKDLGKTISAVMAKLKGRADGSLVSKIIKEFLSVK